MSGYFTDMSFSIHHLFACLPTATGTLAKTGLQRLSIPALQRALELFGLLGVGGDANKRAEGVENIL